MRKWRKSGKGDGGALPSTQCTHLVIRGVEWGLRRGGEEEGIEGRNADAYGAVFLFVRLSLAASWVFIVVKYGAHKFGSDQYEP